MTLKEKIQREFIGTDWLGEEETCKKLSAITFKKVTMYDLVIDDGADGDETEDTYVMRACFAIDGEGVVRIYYGDVTEEIGYVDANLENGKMSYLDYLKEKHKWYIPISRAEAIMWMGMYGFPEFQKRLPFDLDGVSGETEFIQQMADEYREFASKIDWNSDEGRRMSQWDYATEWVNKKIDDINAMADAWLLGEKNDFEKYRKFFYILSK